MRSLPHGVVWIAPSTVVGDHCVFGCVKESRLAEREVDLDHLAQQAAPVEIGENCLIFNHVLIYEGSRLGEGCVVEDRVRIGYDAQVGRDVRLIYGAYLCDRVRVDDGARVAGFVCDGTRIGARSTTMGQLVHEYSQPHRGWWEVDEPSPVVHEDVVVGFGATVVGGVQLGPRSYVAAGAVVTTDVPPGHVVTGVNQLTPASAWQGRRLRELLAYWQRLSPG